MGAAVESRLPWCANGELAIPLPGRIALFAWSAALLLTGLAAVMLLLLAALLIVLLLSLITLLILLRP